jgi:hypothetical protein
MGREIESGKDFGWRAVFLDVKIRVARWFISKPKNRNLGKFWGALEWKM